MAQCQGKTKKGDRCKRDVGDGAGFCTIHQDQKIRERSVRTGEWDTDAIMKAVVGFAIVGVIFLFRFRK